MQKRGDSTKKPTSFSTNQIQSKIFYFGALPPFLAQHPSNLPKPFLPSNENRQPKIKQKGYSSKKFDYTQPNDARSPILPKRESTSPMGIETRER